MPSWRFLFFSTLFLAATAGFYHLFTGGNWSAWRELPLPVMKKPYPRAANPVASGTLQLTGGQFFFQKADLPVEPLKQDSSAWAKQTLAWGQAGQTIGSHGGALTCAVMVMKSYGLKTDPRALNELMTRNKGYTAEGWLVWERVPDLAPGLVDFVYAGEPKYPLIDTSLKEGNAVIARLKTDKETYVVLCGKEGLDYMAVDPAPKGSPGKFPLRLLPGVLDHIAIFKRIYTPRAIPVQ
jgi:hypothetical protein